MTKRENVLEKCRINLDKEKVLHSITRGERDKYKERIDKAIEYIESCTWNNGIDDELQYSLHIPTLLKILKGEDK